MPDRELADALVARLSAWRVPRVFGQPGEAIAPLVEALTAAGGEPDFVAARNGESAALMATGHAGFTGAVGVCLAPEGPAAFGLLAGLDAARRAGLPVLAIVGERTRPPTAALPGTAARPSTAARPGAAGPHGSAGAYPWGEVGPAGGQSPADLPQRVGRLFTGLCRRVWHAGDPRRVAELVDEALRDAVAGAGPVCLVLPHHGPGDGRPLIGPGGSVDPALVVDELTARLPGRVAVTLDGDPLLSGFDHRLPRGAAVLPSDTLGATGRALPYAVAAKLADPDRPVLALVTDEGMQLHGLTELVTVARGWPAWPDPRLVVLVLNTRSGHPARHLADDVPYAGWARLLGLRGVRVDRPELVGTACDEALAAERPCVLEMMVDLASRRLRPAARATPMPHLT
ncbi:thiamine pyrophosphate-binding protein [Micromonospora sp. CA-263727]|uniref:thiamine pyrophosphate-binding protein n=1 Tax=Micromonospora sp. CA-263727 TaxID=3239967 RepID=UPI003D8F40D5